MNPEDMRSLTIYADLETLGRLPDWTNEVGTATGAGEYIIFKHCSQDITIHVRKDSQEEFHTENILPQDLLDDTPELRNDAIMVMKNSLDREGIKTTLHVSDNDKKFVLENQ